MTDTEQAIINIVKEHIDFYDVEIEDSFDRLPVDSLDMIDIAMKVEEEFRIDIGDHEFTEIKTLNDIANIVKGKIDV